MIGTRALRAACGVATLLLGAFCTPLVAQGRLALEVRGGASVPMEDFEQPDASNAPLRPSGAFGVTFHLDRGLGFAFVLGFSQYRAVCDGAACASGDAWVSTQWELGTRWTPARRRVSPWVQAALVIPRVEHQTDLASDVTDTSFGLEGGAGLEVRMTRRWSITPAVRWIEFDADLPGTGNLPVRFLTGDLALRVVF